jgi:hypothetical protein
MRGIQSDIDARIKFERVSASVGVLVLKFIWSLDLQQLENLVLQWQELDHPNILPCLGLTMQFGPIPALIFPMCTEGSIIRYVEAHPEVNKLQLVCYFI